MSQLMSSFNLTIYPIIGLFVFLCVFSAICWKVYRSWPREQLERQGQIPLFDDEITMNHHSHHESAAGNKKTCSGNCGCCKNKDKKTQHESHKPHTQSSSCGCGSKHDHAHPHAHQPAHTQEK